MKKMQSRESGEQLQIPVKTTLLYLSDNLLSVRFLQAHHPFVLRPPFLSTLTSVLHVHSESSKSRGA